MSWQTRVDQLVLKEVDAAGQQTSRAEEIGQLIQALIRLSPGRVQSYFPLGFAASNLGVALEAYPAEELEEDARLWYRFGQALANMRRPRRAAVAANDGEDGAEDGEAAVAEEAAPDLTELLQDADIARDLLPILLKQSLATGDLEDSVRILETVLSSGAPNEDTAELLRSTLGEILRRAERPRESLDTASVLGLLQRCMALPGFDELPAEICAPFHRTLGKLEQHVENYDAAAEHFRKALEVAGEGHTLASVLHFDLAACLLGIRGVPDLEPDADRADAQQAMQHLDEATADAKRASFNAYFTRGVLRYEKGAFDDAAADFRAALERIEMYRNPLPVTLARIRYYLALSLMKGGRPEEQEEAARQLEKSLDRVRPDARTLEELLPLLESAHQRTAVRVLQRVDVNQSEDPRTVLAVGRYYQRLGDAENALKVAEAALEKIEDIGLRKDALLLELRAFNMLGERENAQDALYDLRDLCYQSGDLKFWEEVIFDDDRVGQALNHQSVLGERAELLARLSGRDDERHELVLELATSYLDRAEPHWKLVGLGILREAYRHAPDAFEAAMKEAEAKVGDHDRQYDAEVAKSAREALGRTPTVLVIGGDDHQDRREDDLDQIAGEWRLEAEWWESDHVNPDHVHDRLKEYLTSRQPDGILILHWNRDELVRDVRKLCRSYRIPTRFAHYTGADSLRRGVGELMEAAAQQFSDSDGDESNAAGA